MALSKVDIENMVTGETPVANGGTGQATFAAAGLTRPNANPIWFNGNMHVAQRGEKTGITNGNSAYYACDRYKFNEDGTMSAVLTATQETLTDGAAFTTDGHTRALKYDVTTADTSVGSDIYARITQRFEKQDLQLIKKGTANAQIVTLAFWVKATVTGTNVVEFEDQTNTRHCCATYTISSSNTWEHKVVTFAADTSTGDPFGTGNGLAADINFVLQAGSDYTSGTLATSWADITAANRAAGHNSNHFSSTSNNFHLTGVQMEIGSYTSTTLPPFQHENYVDNLKRCQRYFFQYLSGNSKTVGIGSWWNDSNIDTVIFFPVEMRTAPDLVATNGTNYYYICVAGNCRNISNAWTAGRTNPSSSQIYLAPDATDTGGRAGLVASTSASASIAWEAEL